MKCQRCGNEVRPKSQFCHTCGAPIELINPLKGENIIRVAFVFVGIIPAIATIIELVRATLYKNISLPVIFDLIDVVLILTFFFLVYRGYKWAILPIGLLLIVTSLIRIAILVLHNPVTFLSISYIFFSFFYIVVGIYLMKSKDILAFIDERSKHVG